LCGELRLNDPAAAENNISDIKYSALSGRDRALRVVEFHVRAIWIFRCLDSCLRRGMPIANFYFCADGTIQARNADPIHIANFAHGRKQLVAFANNDAAISAIKLENVERMSDGNSQSFALAYGEFVDAIVMAEHFTAGGNHFAGVRGQSASLLTQICFDELHVISRRHKTNFLTFRFCGDGQLRRVRDCAHFVLLQFAERKTGSRHLFLLQAEKKVGLILGIVGGAKKFVALRCFIESDARVVSGDQSIRADFARGFDELIELHMIVAERARNRRAAGEIVVNKRTDDSIFKTLLEIYNVMRKAEMFGDALGVVHIVDAAATMPFVSLRVEFGKAALIPKLHGEADDWSALLAQHCGDGGTVNATAHRDGGERRGSVFRVVIFVAHQRWLNVRHIV